MKLLIANNISRNLIEALAIPYLGSLHVSAVGLANATYDEIWNYARKVVWTAPGECTTQGIEDYFARRNTQITSFLEDSALAILLADTSAS